MEEREISLVDLMADILLHWRGIIALMLIGGILMGGFSYVRSARSVQVQKAELENIETDRTVILERMRDELTQAQLDNVESVLSYEEQYRTKEAYLKQSIRIPPCPRPV